MLLTPGLLPAQQGTGLPVLGSFAGGPVDTVNLSNLNMHYQIPIFSRPRRGLPFSYALNFDNTVWSRGTSNGVPAWLPDPNWGWSAASEPQSGYLSYSSSQITCAGPGHNIYTDYNNFVYVDRTGTQHSFILEISNAIQYPGCNGGPAASGSASAFDNSGYSVSVAINGGSSFTATVATPSGSTIQPPYNHHYRRPRLCWQ